MEEATGSTTQGGAGQSGGVNLNVTGGSVETKHIIGNQTNIYEAAEEKPRPPYHIPAPPGDFTGREAEIETLIAAAQTGGGLIHGLHGMGGIGKSALAFEVAKRLGGQYPDGHLFIEMAGSSTQPLTPSAAMAQVIRAWDITASVPEDEREVAKRYRTTLHGRSVLLLLDDAAGAAQVEPLMPPAGCKGALLVTTRVEFYLPGLHTLHLDALPKEDAVALLRRIAPRLTEAEAETLAALCGNLPLALRVAASQLATRRALTCAAYLRRLSDSRKRLAWVEATLTLSYDMLDALQQQRWRALATFPATFDAPAAAALWDEGDVDASADTLDALITLSLLECDAPAEGEADGRYRLHDLARLYAHSRLTEEERMSYAHRHAAHYRTLLARADELYLQRDQLGGLRLFDVERENIEAGQAWAAQHAATDNEAASLCIIYATAYPLLDLRVTPHEWLEWLTVAWMTAHHLGNRRAEGDVACAMGIAYQSLGQIEQAIKYHKHYLAITRETGDRTGEGKAIGNLGIAYASLGDARYAITFYEYQLTITREIGDRSGEGTALGNLGVAYATLGELERAVDFYQQHLTIMRECGDRRAEAGTLGNLGSVYKLLGQVRLAIEHHQQHLDMASELGDPHGESAALCNLGSVFLDIGETEKALIHLEQALSIIRKLGRRKAEAITLCNIGLAHLNLNDTPQAITYYDHALLISREVGSKHDEGTVLGELGNAYYVSGETERATAYYEEALLIAQETENRVGEANTLGNLGNVWSARGNGPQALKFYKRQLTLVRQIGDREGEGNALWNGALVLYSLGFLKKSLRRAYAALTIYEQMEHPQAEVVRLFIRQRMS